MKVEDLDEFQDVTPDMVRAAAEARGFIYRDTVLHYPSDKVALFFATNPHLQGHVVVALIAEHLKVSLQLFLREINPRLRKGWPSAAARAAHRGEWLVGIDDGGPGLIMQPYLRTAPFAPSHALDTAAWSPTATRLCSGPATRLRTRCAGPNVMG